MKVCDVFEAAEIGDLPINPAKAAGALGIKTVSYGTMTEIYDIDADYLYRRSPFGFSFKSENRFVIAVNENSCGERKRRFTIAHELGHCVLGHTGRLSENRAPTSFEEHSADRFAADFLAPLPVLILCGAESAEEIKKSAGFRVKPQKFVIKSLFKCAEAIFSRSTKTKKLPRCFRISSSDTARR